MLCWSSILVAQSISLTRLSSAQYNGSHFIWDGEGKWVGGFSYHGQSTSSVYYFDPNNQPIEVLDPGGRFTTFPVLSADGERILMGRAKFNLANETLEDQYEKLIRSATADFPLEWDLMRFSSYWSIRNAQWSPDERYLVFHLWYTGGSREIPLENTLQRRFPDHRLAVFDAKADSVVYQLLDRVSYFEPKQLVVNNQRVIASGGRTLYGWDLKTGKLLFRKDSVGVYSANLSLSPDGSRIALYNPNVASTGVLRLHSTTSGDLISAKETHEGPISHAAFHPTQPLIALASEAHGLAFLSYAGDSLIKVPFRFPDEDRYYNPSFHPDGPLLLTHRSALPKSLQTKENRISTDWFRLSLSDEQQGPQPFKAEKMYPSIWEPFADKATTPTYSDTTSQQLNLVFNIGLRDSIQIFLDDSLVFMNWIEGRLFHSGDLFATSIDYSQHQEPPVLKIQLINRRKMILLKPKPGYQAVMLSRFGDGGYWVTGFTNYRVPTQQMTSLALPTHQKKDVKAWHEETNYATTWEPLTTTNRKMKYADTTQKSINLVFEYGFKDSVRIYLNDSLVHSAWVAYSTRSGTVPPIYTVDYSHLSEVPKLRIELVSAGAFAHFTPKPGYRQVFLERIPEKGHWNLAFSNYGRRYH